MSQYLSGKLAVQWYSVCNAIHHCRDSDITIISEFTLITTTNEQARITSTSGGQIESDISNMDIFVNVPKVIYNQIPV